MTSVAGVMVPYIVEANDSRKQRQRDELLAAMLKYSLLVMGYGLMVLVVHGDTIIGWLTRAEYREVGRLMLWLAPIPVLTASMAPTSTLLFIQNKTLSMMCISSSGVIASMILNVLFIPSYGAIGAAVATSLSLGMVVLLQYWVAFLEDTTQWRSSRAVEIVVAGVCTGTLFFVLNGWIPSDGFTMLLVSAMAMGAVYGLIVFALGVVGPREWDMIVKWWAGPVAPEHLGH
jgi:O-antigen/teichoic acid export membrane protein